MGLKAKGAAAPPVDPGPSLEEDLRYGLREPRGPSEFDLFVEALEDDQRPHAKVLYQMACDHEDADVVMEDATWSEPDKTKKCLCPRCKLLFTRHPTKSATKLAEWRLYCPEGYDAFDWEDLFVTDKSLWPYIYDEAEYALVADSMTRED